MTIKEIRKQLCDGLSFTSKEKLYIEKRLRQIMKEDNLTINELNENCWKDSDAIFNRIWKYETDN